LIKVHALNLCETLCNDVCLVLLNSAVGSLLNMENPLASNNLVAFCESTKQAPCLTEFEGGRLPSTDTKIQAQLRDKIKSVELGRKKEQQRPVEGNKGGLCGLLSCWSTSWLTKQK